jgi:predicted branched-subunit amino acid permease
METEIASTTTTSPALAGAAGSVKAFLLAHPIGVAVIGGALVGMGAYYLANKYSKKKEEGEEAATAA